MESTFTRWLLHKKISLVHATLLILCALHPVSARAEVSLTFGVYTADRPMSMVVAYRPILSALEEVLSDELQENVIIRMQIASSYQKGIEALASGAVDFAMLGPASYIEARKLQPSLQILALESKDGSKTFNGVVCVREDSEINSISDLNGKRFAFGNRRSTIGRYLSQALLASNKIAAHNLHSYDYLNRHDRVAQSVALGRHDAGALKEGTFRKYKKKGYKLRSLVTIPLINRPWVASATLEKSIYSQLKESMLTLVAPDAFKAMGRRQFIEGNDADFADIRSAIRNNHKFFSRTLEHAASSVQ